MDSDTLAKLKADILESVGALIDERVSAVSEPVGPDPLPHICVFEWASFAGDPEGFYTGQKVAYPSKNLSLSHTGPHESAVCYDAMAERLHIYGDKVPRRVRIGGSVVSTAPGIAPGKVVLLGQGPAFSAPLSRDGFRELLVEVAESAATHWQAVLDGFDHLPPPQEKAA